MEISLSAEQSELKEATADFARAKLTEDLANREESGEFPSRRGRTALSSGFRLFRSGRPGRRGQRYPDHGPCPESAGLRLSGQRAHILAQRADLEP
jgi:hypothetical protein